MTGCRATQSAGPRSVSATLPHLTDAPFITDGGMETTLIFHRGLDLPLFASFDLLRKPKGVAELRAYYERYIAIAEERGVGIVLDTPTWRANPDWGKRLGYSPEELDETNRKAVELVRGLRETSNATILVSGCVGPRGDGYVATALMTPEEAKNYHARQVEVFAWSKVDLISALTMTHADEAIGIVGAARAVGVPVVVSFTVETDGRLPSGQSLREAIEQVDGDTDEAPAYYMINCAHPTHFADVLDEATWRERIRGLRANASTK